MLNPFFTPNELTQLKYFYTQFIKGGFFKTSTLFGISQTWLYVFIVLVFILTYLHAKNEQEDI